MNTRLSFIKFLLVRICASTSLALSVATPSPVSLHLNALNEGHDSGEESLQVDDWLCSLSASALEHHGKLQHDWLDLLGQCTCALLWLQEFACQVLKDHI